MRDFRETIQRHGVEMLCHGVVNLGDMLQVGWDYYNSWVWGCCANRAFEKKMSYSSRADLMVVFAILYR